ncbi:hypothetical protein QBC47DRAFT_25991 [Echria macrotheca]|uniref:Uncharacterized protein n=1 Tax=Echria macrotheca TaxID=438768 RepID=A0AAJ0FBP7_9PEZI|nr:hypothetical protein QBC47DRAFT_25991 [Echria macrotheca]
MANLQDTTARLRRTFRYPADEDEDSDGSIPDVMDEEEQETLITSLAQKNAHQNKQIHTTLLLIPLLATLPFLFSLPRTPQLSILSITSLLTQSYLTYILPPTMTGLSFVDSSPSSSSSWVRGGRTGGFGGEKTGYIAILNLVLGVVVAFAGFVKRDRYGGGGGWGGWVVAPENLPLLVQVLGIGVRRVMGSVDPAVELGGLRYGYKGA